METFTLYKIILIVLAIYTICLFFVIVLLKKKYPLDYKPVQGIMVRKYLNYWYSIMNNKKFNLVIRTFVLFHIMLYSVTILFTFTVFIVLLYSLFK